MKNVIKSNDHPISSLSKTGISRRFLHSIPAVALCLALASALLTGCFEPQVQQTVYKETSDTIASVYSENDVGGTGLPFGVTLQVDPEVLVRPRP